MNRRDFLKLFGALPLVGLAVKLGIDNVFRFGADYATSPEYCFIKVDGGFVIYAVDKDGNLIIKENLNGLRQFAIKCQGIKYA
jgi:hypothetical protein